MGHGHSSYMQNPAMIYKSLGFRVGIASRYILKHMEFDRKSIVDRDYADYSDFKADVHSLWTAMPVFVCCH